MSRLRFGAAIPVLNEFRFLPAVVGQLFRVCDRVLLLRGTKSFSGAAVEVKPLPKFSERVEVLQKSWESEGDARNEGMHLLGADCDYVFTVDTDEILTNEALVELCRTAGQGHHAIACHLRTYWKTPRFETMPHDRIPCAILLRRDQRFRFMRVLDGQPHIVPRARVEVHHLSYVRTDEEVREKLRCYGHAEQVYDVDRWFEERWRRWDSDHALTHLHPVSPATFLHTQPVEDPVLEAILSKWGVR